MICLFLAYPHVQQAITELSDVALLTAKRGRTQVAAGVSPVMRAGPPCRPYPDHKLVPARIGPLPAGCST